MLWLLCLFCDPQPRVIRDLQSDRYAVRAKAERELTYTTAWQNQWHPDSHVRLACESRVREDVVIAAWERACVATFLLLAPSGDGEEYRLSPATELWVDKYLENHQLGGGLFELVGQCQQETQLDTSRAALRGIDVSQYCGG